jgi:epoxyqueuosine reductase
VSRYARGRDYHNVLGKRLRKLATFADELAPGSRTVTAVDYRPVLEKEWAERAGLGWIGKHTNLITGDRGSWFFLSELVTELDLAVAGPPAKERCGSCVACLDACPTGAIVAPFRVDARRCISWLTIENDGPIPPELRPLVGEWIFGCDVCQEVCPWNRFAVPVEEPAFRLDEGRFSGDLAGFLRLTEAEFLRRFEGSPVRRAKRDGFLRNVCVALGNRRDPGDVPALGRALADPSALVRGHAAWALGRIGGPEAERLLRGAETTEAEAEVREEITSALTDR